MKLKPGTWISFSEKLPHKRSRVIVCGKTVSHGKLSSWYGKPTFFDELRQDYRPIDEYTHWQAFPKPPKK